MRWGEAYRFFFRGWLPSDPNAKILDIGCGSGKFLYVLKQQGYDNLYGVDLSDEQVAIARQIEPNVHRGDVLDYLRQHRNAFDLITGLDLIEHLKKDELLVLLDEVREALKPDGRLILQTPNGDSPFFGPVLYGDFTHETCLTPSLLTMLLRQAGLREVEAREQGPVPWGHGWRSALRFLGWQLIRTGVKARNLIETGGAGGGIFSRVFCISALR
jgi:2-polyprenyl-3-methyl-5-hydroxy-6-metoxy-1,4-benzoquinol methylase